MAVKEKIRIRLQSYDAQLIDAAAEKIVEMSFLGNVVSRYPKKRH